MIELMVVIAIVAATAIFSIESYKSYTVKSKFAQIFSTIERYKDDAQAAYIDGDEFPSQFSGLTTSTYNSISAPGLALAYYGRSTNKQAAYFQFFTIDLGISGYVAANGSGSGGTSCRVTTAIVRSAAGHMQLYCGQWDGSSTDVPLTYLPKSCQDTNISALIS